MVQKLMVILLVTLGFLQSTFATTYIAYARNGAWGTGLSPRDAVNKCLQFRGDYCQTANERKGYAWGVRSGLYISVYRSPSYIFGFASGNTPRQAQDAAYAFCNKLSANCAHQKTFVAH